MANGYLSPVTAPRFYPLEIDLHDRPVLMVGAGPVAARKLPELLACGARVTVVAPEVSPAVQHLLPGLVLHRRAFAPADVEGMTLVFACTNLPDVNTAVADACRARGIPCNRADRAKQGTFIVPGVVRRGGVTISVSTSGQVPALTRHLKRRLSGVLGEEWGVLAEILGVERDRDHLPAADLLHFEALAAAVREGGPAAARALLAGAAQEPGNAVTAHPVVLAGAGPGDPGLLTLGAVEALRRADVVLYDRLASQAVLDHAAPNATRIPVEKHGHFTSKRQEHIHDEMIAHARAGKRVVRLKGGDPFVFGRGWEEVLALEAAGIPWRVLPGVTSSVSVPALAGIPLTHRGVARTFAVASGVAGTETNTEYPKADTLVILMALFRLAEIVPHLLRAGYAPGTPAAVIQDGSLPEQRVLRATLETLADEAARAGFDSPALVVVGKVVGLNEK